MTISKTLMPRVLAIAIFSSALNVLICDRSMAVGLYGDNLTNTTGLAVNDLSVVFSHKVNGPKLTGKLTPGGPVPLPGPILPDDPTKSRRQFVFDPINPGEGFTLVLSSRCLTCRIDADNSYWTIDDKPVKEPGGINVKEAPRPKVREGGRLAAGSPLIMSFFNPNDQPLIYSNIVMSKDNNIANFNLDSYLTVTGSQVRSPIDSFILAPGQTLDLTFNDVLPNFGTYALLTADVAFLSKPTETSQVSAAYDYSDTQCVPEPASILGTLAFSSSLLAFNRKRKKQQPKEAIYSNAAAIVGAK
jgi:hypothetical protein